MRRVGASLSKAPTHKLQISFNSRSKSQELGSGTDRIGFGPEIYLEPVDWNFPLSRSIPSFLILRRSLLSSPSFTI